MVPVNWAGVDSATLSYRDRELLGCGRGVVIHHHGSLCMVLTSGW